MWLIFWFYIHCKIINQLTLNRRSTGLYYGPLSVISLWSPHIHSFCTWQFSTAEQCKRSRFLADFGKNMQKKGGGHQHSRQDIPCAHQKSANMESPKFACVVFTSAHAVSEFGYAVSEFNMPYPKSGTAYQIFKFPRVARILYETHLIIIIIISIYIALNNYQIIL